MNRIAMSDGRWFDANRATEYKEATYHDGRNHISRATGSQWEHEELYRTAGGAWVLHRWSQWQGSTPSYTVVSGDTATRWLIRNEHDMPADLQAAGQALEV